MNIHSFILAIGLLSTIGQKELAPQPKQASENIPQVDEPVNSFMHNYNIPGLSVAITKGEKLVYAKSYGKADVGNAVALTNYSLFRIASLSKSITAVGILKLIENDKLGMDSKVFGPGAVLGTMYGTPPYKRHITDITIDQLLHHTAGGWTNDGSDPMFTNSHMTQAQLISWTLDNRPLTNIPGKVYAYSNFGYCILGRVIEAVTGEPYAKWIKENVLRACGITDIQIAGNTLLEKKNNEVTYYGQGGENPYGDNINRMDSHGGWLATATDLARFLVHIDGFPNKRDILNEASINLLTTPSAANPQYACGLSITNNNNWWHTGSLYGSSSEMVRTAGGFNWVILCNSSSKASDFSAALDKLIWIAVKNSDTQWPTTDGF